MKHLLEKKTKHFFIFFYFCFTEPKDVKLNIAQCFIMQNSNKRELRKIVFNHSPYISFEDFTESLLLNHILFLLDDTTLASDNLLSFKKNLLGKI